MSRRVTLFINSLRGGGAEHVCATVANELRALGWEVEVLVLNLRGAVVREMLDPDVPVIDLGIEHVRYSAAAVLRYLHRRRPGCFLVFNHQLAVLLVWLRGLRAGRFRIVARNISTLSRKDALEPSFWHRRIVRGLTIAFYRHADAIIAQSAGMKRDLVAHYGLDEGQVRVIHNPLAAQFDRLRNLPPVPWHARRNEILFVGRLAVVKGLDLLVGACALCMAQNPGLVLRLVGAGDQLAALRSQAAAAGIADRVIFEGYAVSTAHFHANARLLALTSHYEGFPNVLIEALAAGTPVVSVDCESGPAEIIQSGVNGYLARSRDPRDLAGLLQQALDTRWNPAGIQRTAARYSSRAIAGEYAEMLDEAGSASASLARQRQ